MKKRDNDEDFEEGLLPASTAVNVEKFVDYAKGSVVSKTLVDNSAGTLTLFSFDKGQGLSEHSAPFDAVVQVIDGEVEIKIGGKPVRASKGEMVLMPANIPHALKATKRFKMLLTMLRAK